MLRLGLGFGLGLATGANSRCSGNHRIFLEMQVGGMKTRHDTSLATRHRTWQPPYCTCTMLVIVGNTKGKSLKGRSRPSRHLTFRTTTNPIHNLSAVGIKATPSSWDLQIIML